MSIIILSLIVIISFVYVIVFIASQGKDERGQAIIAFAAQCSLSIVILGFVLQSFLFQYFDPTTAQIRIMIHAWMAAVFLSYAVMVFILNRRS